MAVNMIKEEYITHNREPFFQIALDYIKQESKVLDIGPGNGSFPQFCNREDFYLLEGNKETVELLKKSYSNVVEGVLPDMPFENDFFDVIHCSHVIEHLQPQELYDTLVNIDRVLKIGGYLIISAPLLWSGFYNDLSHVKPYYPFVFEKYLTGNYPNSLTRKLISSAFVVEKLEYRYLYNKESIKFYNRTNSIIGRIFQSVCFRVRKRGLEVVEKTGYTIVLRKNG